MPLSIDRTRYRYHLLTGQTLEGTLYAFTDTSNTIEQSDGRKVTIPWSAVAYREEL